MSISFIGILRTSSISSTGRLILQHQTLKALTLWQPWATLIALGQKRFETRSWATHYRGDLLIHAAKRLPERGQGNAEIVGTLKAAGINKFHDMPYGASLCVVNLLHVFPVENALYLNLISDRELAFGDYSPGRYVWELVDLRRFANPIPMAGHQKLWSPPDFDMTLISEAIIAKITYNEKRPYKHWKEF